MDQPRYSPSHSEDRSIAKPKDFISRGVMLNPLAIAQLQWSEIDHGTQLEEIDPV